LPSVIRAQGEEKSSRVVEVLLARKFTRLAAEKAAESWEITDTGRSADSPPC
jgi:hypothetical protein